LAVTVEVKLRGLDGVLKRLRSITPKLQAKGLRAAGTKAMRIVRDAARNRVRALDDPKTPANIAKNIVTRYDAKGSKREGGLLVKVGIIGGARPHKGNADTGHWRFVEFGKEGVPARPFMRPALETNAQRVADIFTTELNAQLDKLGD
jgi:HK97 gp10 family phage protein